MINSYVYCTFCCLKKWQQNSCGATWGHQPHNFLAVGAIAPMESVPMLPIKTSFCTILLYWCPIYVAASKEHLTNTPKIFRYTESAFLQLNCQKSLCIPFSYSGNQARKQKRVVFISEHRVWTTACWNVLSINGGTWLKQTDGGAET